LGQPLKIALVIGAALIISTWYYVRSQPEQVCARGLSSETGESYDHALVRCSMTLR